MEDASVLKSKSYFLTNAGAASPPEVEELTPAAQDKTQDYVNRLKTYLISGKKSSESVVTKAFPLVFAGHLQAEQVLTEFPVYYDTQHNELISLFRRLQELIAAHFDQDATAIILKELPGIYAEVQDQEIRYDEKESGTQHVLEMLTKEIQTLEFPQKEKPEFENKMADFRKELQREVDSLYPFHGKTAIQILNLQCKRRRDLKYEFVQMLKNVISGLNELLILHGDDSGLSDIHMDFAEDLISFDRIKEVSISKVSSELPKAQLQRLRSAIQTLTHAQQYYRQRTSTVFTTEELNQSFELEQIFDASTLKVVTSSPCHHANLQAQKDVHEFIQTMAALRMGQLMIDQEYDEILHDDYFDHFDLSHLSEDDLRYLPNTFVIESTRSLALQASDFFTAVSKNSFVKVLGLNLLDDLFDLTDQDKTDWLELASLAIFRRNSYVFQGGMDLSSDLNESYAQGLAFAGPVFWNVLIPSEKPKAKPEAYIALKAAIESRYFPRITYRASDNYFTGSQIDLQNNPLTDENFISREEKLLSSGKTKSIALSLTVADFLAIDTQLQESLEIVPPVYQNANLIPLRDYLSPAVAASSNQLPFIWLVDAHNKLRQAVIPVSWIQKCRRRLEYWNFLQSISGINKVQLQHTLEAVKSEWETAKSTEIEVLRSKLQKNYEQEKATGLKKAVTNMLLGLLNQGNRVESVLDQISKTAIEPKPEPEPEQGPAAQPAIEAEKAINQTAVKAEAWVESEDCTSCKDCIDALPSVFKYNENRQAYVHNPQGGTFAQIVKAAEKCPARCIYPGTPQNKNEADLDKWMKRAEKFN